MELGSTYGESTPIRPSPTEGSEGGVLLSPSLHVHPPTKEPIIEKQHTTPPSPSVLRDLMGNVPLKDAATATMSVADALQHSPLKGTRLMGLACAFLMAAESAGLPVPDLMGMARNCMNDGEGRRPEFRAVDDFISNEILNNHHDS